MGPSQTLSQTVLWVFKWRWAPQSMGSSGSFLLTADTQFHLPRVESGLELISWAASLGWNQALLPAPLPACVAGLAGFSVFRAFLFHSDEWVHPFKNWSGTFSISRRSTPSSLCSSRGKTEPQGTPTSLPHPSYSQALILASTTRGAMNPNPVSESGFPSQQLCDLGDVLYPF